MTPNVHTSFSKSQSTINHAADVFYMNPYFCSNTLAHGFKHAPHSNARSLTHFYTNGQNMRANIQRLRYLTSHFWCFFTAYCVLRQILFIDFIFDLTYSYGIFLDVYEVYNIFLLFEIVCWTWRIYFERKQHTELSVESRVIINCWFKRRREKKWSRSIILFHLVWKMVLVIMVWYRLTLMNDTIYRYYFVYYSYIYDKKSC